MELRVEKVAKSKRKREIKEVYLSSFPKEERMPFSLMLMMSCLWNTDFLAFYDGDTLCGFVYLASIRKLTFLMFFAVAESLRSQGYGSRILEELQARKEDHKIVVSIEPCDGTAEDMEQRIRRKRFYQKNGYAETGYFMKLAGQKQEILIKNGVFSKKEFTLFFLQYSNLTTIPKLWKVTPE